MRISKAHRVVVHSQRRCRVRRQESVHRVGARKENPVARIVGATSIRERNDLTGQLSVSSGAFDLYGIWKQCYKRVTAVRHAGQERAAPVGG